MAKIKKPSKKIITIIVLFILTIGGAIFWYKNTHTSQPITQDTSNQETLNLNPPTEEEIKQAADNKQRIDENAERIKTQQQNSLGSPKSVTPIISFAEQNNNAIEVGSYVPGIFEDGGNCTALITKGQYRVTKSVQGVKEGSNTFCPKFVINKDEFPEGGSWSVLVIYESGYAKGQSEPKGLEVK